MTGPRTLTAALIVAAATVTGADTPPGAPGGNPATSFDAGRTAIRVTLGGVTIPYSEFAVYVLPGAAVSIVASPRTSDHVFDLSWRSGTGRRDDPASWTWTAPTDVGLTEIVLRERGSNARITINVFVMVPFATLKGETLNGYRIGSYPKIPLRGLSIYRPPKGFVEVTRDNADTRISPHFVLRQFLCKQAGGWPKYVVLRPLLLLKLEMMLEQINNAGLRCDSFHVMSGYRTPFYNHAIGNVKYSRHQWGGAADIFVDVDPEDGLMDDLNGDGKIDVRDARRLYDLVDDLYGSSSYEPFVGGLGLYRTTVNHGPFIHVDVRGFHARWGD